MSIQHMQMVFDAGDLTAPQKSVLLAYCNFTDPHGYCWPGVERIADMTGLSVSGVKKIRKQLVESRLMVTVSRGKKGGGRKTNGSRINIKRLQKMKLPPREYDDNLMAELGFEEDDEAEAPEAKVPEGHTNGSREARQKYPGGTNEGACGDPYPSVDPSGEPSGEPSSSSAGGHVQREPAPVVAEKKTKSLNEREAAERIIGERLPDSTARERAAVVDAVLAEAASNGKRITFIDRWMKGRPQLALEQDIAHVRRFADAPPLDGVCSEHGVSLAAGCCSSCEGDMNTGDFEAVRKILAREGADARPDLARRVGAPQAPAGSRSRYQPYRNPVNTADYYADF